MSPESFDPFSEDGPDDIPPSSKPTPHRRERAAAAAAEEKEGGPSKGHSRRTSALHGGASSSIHIPSSAALTSASRLEANALLLSSRFPAHREEASSLTLTKRQMRAVASRLRTAHPALVAQSGEEEKEEEQTAPPNSITRERSSSLASSTLYPSSSSPSSLPSSTGSELSLSTTALSKSAAPLTPRLSFSAKRADKFDESVKVMMSFSHADMESIRTEILQRGGGVNRSQFLAISVKARPGHPGYEREVEALAEMFEEIDVNGDGDLRYSEFTSYLVELANGRYDHHHIDRLLHTDYHHLEPVTNDDRIDVTLVRWVQPIGHFLLLEKGQHRFKLLDAHKKTVKVVRGHAGDVLDCEWLPTHGALVTSSSDRTLRFWSVDDRAKTKEGKDLAKLPLSKGISPGGQVGGGAAGGGGSGGTFPTFNCLSVWALPSPQVCLCWAKGRLYSADILGRLLVWNIDVGEVRTSTQAHEGRVTCLIAAIEDGAVISGGMDGRVRVWDCMDTRCVAEWRHDGAVRALAWDGPRRLVLSGGDDDCVVLWDAAKKERVRSMNFRQESERDVGKKNALRSAARDRRRAQDEAASRVESGDSILGLCITGEEALVISQYGIIRVLHLAKWAVEQTMSLPRVWDDERANDAESDSESDAEDEEADAAAKEELSLRARDLVTSFTVIRSYPVSAVLSHAASSSPPPENVLVVSAGSTLYSFTRNSAVNHFIAESHPILSAVYNPTTFTVMTASHRSLKVWDCITGRLLKEFHDIVPRGCVVSSVCLDSRGRKVIVAGSDGGVAVYNCNTGAAMQQLDRHEGEVLNLRYVEEVNAIHRDDQPEEADPKGRAAAAAEPKENKILCSCRSGVYIHHDNHEGDALSTGYTSLYHASFDHHSDITALASSSAFRIIAAASSDASIIVYPANLDGTPLQKIHVGSTATALLFLHPHRLLLVAAGQGSVLVYALSREQHVLLGQWTNASPSGETSNVLCIAIDASTETLYTGDESGCIRAWPLSEALIGPFGALVADQRSQPSASQLPASEAVQKFFPDGCPHWRRGW